MLWKSRKTISRGPRLGSRPFQTFCSSMSVHVRPVRSVYVRPRPSCPSRLLAEKIKKYDRNILKRISRSGHRPTKFCDGDNHSYTHNIDWSQLWHYHFSEDCSSLAGRFRPVRSRPSMSVLSVPSVRFCNTLREASARYMGHTASVLSVRVCPRPSSVHVRPVCLVRLRSSAPSCFSSTSVSFVPSADEKPKKVWPKCAEAHVPNNFVIEVMKLPLLSRNASIAQAKDILDRFASLLSDF